MSLRPTDTAAAREAAARLAAQDDALMRELDGRTAAEVPATHTAAVACLVREGKMKADAGGRLHRVS